MRREHVCAAAGLVLAAAYWLTADALPTSALADSVGADGLPKLLAVLLAGISVLIALRPGASPEPLKRPLRALGVAGLGAAYVAVVPLTGYFAAIALLSAGAALHYGARGRVVALFALGTAAVLWLLFAQVLGVALPG